MSDLNTLFRKRIHYPTKAKITFQQLNTILEETAKNIPFENLCVIEDTFTDLTKENLMNKMLVKNEGGLCYELNTLLYLFLIENRFDAVLVRGVVYNHDKKQYQTSGRTHVLILVTHKDTTYVIDTGFGGNLPLKPVPLSGEAVVSSNGEFRVKKADSPYGDYIFEMKLKHKHSEWKTGYAFDSSDHIKDVTQLNDIQTIIANHSDSPFNKHPLLTKRTDNGNVTLTDTSFTHWKDGEMTKEEIDHEGYKKLLTMWFK
ncbi:arylamine N-acetyltransferase family protein [Rossellomorea aquimaris]|uniref:arylamine N-acetyltransferase family protein n=1 Tax=Rossellomorea aquimaris TaxID=189382 RepID=UPI0005CAB87F|nr:arylamine N-acetyltransferase [Rossellomorea aquimaris]